MNPILADGNSLLLRRIYPLPSGGGHSSIVIEISLVNLAVTASEVRELASILNSAEQAADSVNHRTAGGKGSTA